MYFQTLLSLFAFLIFASDASSQTETKSTPTHTLSFVPVGPGSEARWEGVGQEAQLYATDPHAPPPRTLGVLDGEEVVSRLAILNRPSPQLTVEPGTLAILAAEEGTALTPESPVFSEVRIPETPGHYDLFLTRNPSEDTWEDALTFLVPGGIETFPTNHVRLINMTNFQAVARINDERVGIGPAEVKLVPIDQDRVSILCAYLDRQDWKMVMRTRINLDEGARISVVIYPSRKADNPSEAAVYFQPKYGIEEGE